ncbi:MAG: hypothetical protein AAF196_13665 [Planctomycetota bacterium]
MNQNPPSFFFSLSPLPATLLGTFLLLAPLSAQPDRPGANPPSIEARVEASLDGLSQNPGVALNQLNRTIAKLYEGEAPVATPLLAARYTLLSRLSRHDQARSTLEAIREQGGRDWDAWAAARLLELEALQGAQDPEIPTILREAVEKIGRHQPGNDTAKRQISSIGAPATPAILDGIENGGFAFSGVEQLIQTLAMVADERAVDWMEDTLRSGDDPLLKGLIAEQINRVPASARQRLAAIALQSDNRQIRWSAFFAYDGPSSDRLFEVAEEILTEQRPSQPHSMFELLKKLDPTDPRTLEWFGSAVTEFDNSQGGRGMPGVVGFANSHGLQQFLDGIPDSASKTLIDYCVLMLEQRDAQMFQPIERTIERRPEALKDIVTASIFGQLSPAAREWFAQMRFDNVQDPENLRTWSSLSDEMLDRPESLLRCWRNLDDEEKRADKDRVRQAIRFATSSNEFSGFAYEICNDVANFGWTDLAPDLISLLDTDRGSRFALEAATRLAPREVFRHAARNGNPIGAGIDETIKEDLPLLVRGAMDLNLSYQQRKQSGAGSCFQRVLQLAGAEDMATIAPLAKVSAATLNSLNLSTPWSNWLRQNLRPGNLPFVLEQAPLSDATLYRVADISAPQSIEQIFEALQMQRGSTSESRRAELEIITRAFLDNGGQASRLFSVALEEVDVLRGLRNSDSDRTDLWTRIFERGITEDEWKIALQDLQVSANEQWIDRVLSEAPDSWIGDRTNRDQIVALLARIDRDKSVAFCGRILEPVRRGEVLDYYGAHAVRTALKGLGQFADTELLSTLALALDARTQQNDNLSRDVVPELVRTFSIEAAPYLIEALKSEDAKTAEAARQGLDRLEQVLEQEKKWREMAEQNSAGSGENEAESGSAGDGRR